MNGFRSRFAVGALFCLLYAAIATGAEVVLAEGRINDALKASVRSSIEREMDEHDLVGVGIVLVDSRGNTWSDAFGLASRDDQRKLTANTPVALHEFANLFTAVAVMQLVEQGKVDLDALYQRYVPEFSPHDPKRLMGAMTVRHLLTHHSGLPVSYRPGFVQTRGGSDDLPEDWHTRYRENIANSSEVTFNTAPGEVFDYSVLGYTLLGVLIERVSEQDYVTYIDEHILRPLGMVNTSFGASRGSTRISNMFDGREEIAPLIYRDLPADGLISSASDMGLFLKALIHGGGGVIAAETLDEMFRVQNAQVVQDGNFRISLGFYVTPTIGGRTNTLDSISHAVDYHYAKAYLLAVPAAGTGAVVISNTNSPSYVVSELADEFVIELLPEDLSDELVPYAHHRDAPLDRELSALVVGDYSTPVGLERIVVSGEKLRVKVTNMPIVDGYLLPREEGFFGMQIKLFKFVPLRLFPGIREVERRVEFKFVELEGRTNIFVYYGGTVVATMSRLDPPAVGEWIDAWRSRVGTYQYQGDPDSSRSLWFDEESGYFIFGEKGSLIDPFANSQVYCVVDEVTMKRCGSGISLIPGIKNTFRVNGNGEMIPSYGGSYERL
jgi:CubicO group peptidase (beta-lactamase class C family)